MCIGLTWSYNILNQHKNCSNKLDLLKFLCLKPNKQSIVVVANVDMFL